MALPKFEGKQVVASRITVPGMGGGLNDALDVEPVALKHGQRGFGIFEYEVRDVDHVPLKRGESAVLARHHVLTADRVMLVSDDDDKATVQVMLAANADRIQRAKDSMEGQGRIDDEIPDDELTPEELKVRKALRGEK